MYAASLSLNTLRILHEIYLNVVDQIDDVYYEPYQYKNRRGETLLHSAIKTSILMDNEIKRQVINLSTVEYILNTFDININSICKKKNTPLHLACRFDVIKLVQMLLFYGANKEINAINKFKKTPFCYAVENMNTYLCKLLLRYKANYKYAKYEENYYTNTISDIINNHKIKIDKRLYKSKSNKCNCYYKFCVHVKNNNMYKYIHYLNYNTKYSSEDETDVIYEDAVSDNIILHETPETTETPQTPETTETPQTPEILDKTGIIYHSFLHDYISFGDDLPFLSN
jgi:hypothetical protein